MRSKRSKYLIGWICDFKAETEEVTCLTSMPFRLRHEGSVKERGVRGDRVSAAGVVDLQMAVSMSKSTGGICCRVAHVCL